MQSSQLLPNGGADLGNQAALDPAKLALIPRSPGGKVIVGYNIGDVVAI